MRKIMSATAAFIAAICLSIANAQTGPLTVDFTNWLNDNGYAGDNFERREFGNTGSYGGRATHGESISNEPVIFVHGNSDSALNAGSTDPGWSNTIQYFLQKGFTTAELYATTWGDRNSVNAAQRTHNCETLRFLRRFFEAVLAYTNATKIDVIAHSMGVTLARRVIKGGSVSGSDGNCNLGPSLKQYVDTFYGISGANFGLCSCSGSIALFEPTCNSQNGFWPGDSCSNGMICGFIQCPNIAYSAYMTALNTDGIEEATYVYSVWSTTDDLIQYSDQVWGRPTSYIVGSTANKTYTGLTHMQTKGNTAADQYEGVVNHHV